MNRPQQLLLPLNPAQHQTFSSFADTGNELALESARQLADGTSLVNGLLLLGPRGSGKTHLLQAACHHLLQQQAGAIYLNLAKHPQLHGLEHLQLLALDNVHTLAGQRELQEELFHLFNRCQGTNLRLLLASQCAPAQMSDLLPDLQSRLMALQQARMHAIHDQGLLNVIQALSQQMQMDCPQPVLRYLQLHGPRDAHALVNLLYALAEASLQHKRRPSVPLLREIMSKHTDALGGSD